jgi:hypothetical protein
LRDLDRLQKIEVDDGGAALSLRAPATGVVGPLFKAAGFALPPNVHEAAAS